MEDLFRSIKPRRTTPLPQCDGSEKPEPEEERVSPFEAINDSIRRIILKRKPRKRIYQKTKAGYWERQVPPPLGSRALKVSSTYPMDQVPAILSQPLSSTMLDPKSVVFFDSLDLCPTCYNLDAQKAPQQDANVEKPWMQGEYVIPEDAFVAKILISNSSAFCDSARRGCLYCSIAVKALDAALPDWQTGKPFVHIFLATGLPVIIHMSSWSWSSKPTGTQDDVTVRFDSTATSNNQTKSTIDIEIYRPQIREDELTIGDIAVAPLVEHIGFAAEIGVNSGDPTCLDFIKARVADCSKQHRWPFTTASDRVIWIEADNASGIRLLEPKNIRGRYITLSYCWGLLGPNTYLTTEETLNARKAGIEFEDLPVLFQDVITAARNLGIDYVWIDRLCIIQGDNVDFLAQAPKMDEIYGNATLTIAAASATNENDRILNYRESKYISTELKIYKNDFLAVNLRSRQLSHTLGKGKLGGDYGKMSTRAWTWQERLLAARTVFFTPEAIKFECRAQSSWEGTDPRLSGPSWSAQLDNMTHAAWTTLVEEYMKRNITRSSDRLPAMDAVMKRIRNSTRWTPFWGLWENTLIESLSWEVDSSEHFKRHGAQMNPQFYAPTWSWASVDGPISYASVKSVAAALDDPTQWMLECRSLNEASGLIRVAGKLLMLGLECEINARDTVKNENSQEENYQYSYRLRSGSKNGALVLPDVALKRWSSLIQGEQTTSVVRVPYGEAPPTRSWSTRCGCLLLGKHKLGGGLALILGQSLREPNAWERVGICIDIDPAIFTMKQTSILDLA